MLTLIPKYFIRYKFLNSLFLGISVGSIFTLYTPLEPSIYSMGGIVLALCMLFIAKLYPYILNTLWFFRISLLVEVILLLAIVFFLVKSYTYQTALIMYIGYQVTFVFGSYLIRIETLLLKTDHALSQVDSAKQLGYLVGMVLSYFFYQFLKSHGYTHTQEQVYLLHFVLLFLETIIILFILKSFQKSID